jgi:hypothetical protein
VPQDEYDFSRDEKEYTFIPNASRSGISPSRFDNSKGFDDSTFQINVNIGNVKRVITASLNSSPERTAAAFISSNKLDKKY